MSEFNNLLSEFDSAVTKIATCSHGEYRHFSQEREQAHAELKKYDAALRATITQQAQELERVKQDVEKYKALLLQSCRDNIEDFKVQCKPKCDSYGHEDDCPAVYPGLVYDEMRQQLAARERERDEKSLEIIKLRHEVWGCIGQRDAAVQEAVRLREVIDKLKQKVSVSSGGASNHYGGKT